MSEDKHPNKLSESEARLKISNFCAYQERSPKQVLQKLDEFDTSPEVKRSVYQWAIEENFVNECRFAESYVHGKFSLKQWGKYKIKAGLVRHEISGENIQKAVEKIDTEEYRRTLNHLAEKKITILKGSGREKKIKLINFLIGKGFERQLVLEQVNKMRNE